MKLQITDEFKAFSVPRGSVIFKHNKDYRGVLRPRVEIQVIDYYSFQREWSIGLEHEPGNIEKLRWVSHAYLHPGQRSIVEISEGVAVRMINRIADIVANNPNLLFAEKNNCRQFVHVHQALVHGATPSVKLL